MSKFLKYLLIVIVVVIVVVALLIVGLGFLGFNFLKQVGDDVAANSCHNLEMVLIEEPINYSPDFLAEVFASVSESDPTLAYPEMKKQSSGEFDYIGLDEANKIEIKLGEEKIVVRNTESVGFDPENKTAQKMSGTIAAAYDSQTGYGERGTEIVSEVLIALSSGEEYSVSHAGWDLNLKSACK